MVVSIIGFLMFFYVLFGFFQIISGGPGGLSTGVPSGFRIFPLAFSGILLAAAGGQLRRIGRKGLAGAGVVLSPQGEATDAEPWGRSDGQPV